MCRTRVVRSWPVLGACLAIAGVILVIRPGFAQRPGGGKIVHAVFHPPGIRGIDLPKTNKGAGHLTEPDPPSTGSHPVPPKQVRPIRPKGGIQRPVPLPAPKDPHPAKPNLIKPIRPKGGIQRPVPPRWPWPRPITGPRPVDPNRYQGPPKSRPWWPAGPAIPQQRPHPPGPQSPQIIPLDLSSLGRTPEFPKAPPMDQSDPPAPQGEETPRAEVPPQEVPPPNPDHGTPDQQSWPSIDNEPPDLGTQPGSDANQQGPRVEPEMTPAREWIADEGAAKPAGNQQLDDRPAAAPQPEREWPSVDDARDNRGAPVPLEGKLEAPDWQLKDLHHGGQLEHAGRPDEEVKQFLADRAYPIGTKFPDMKVKELTWTTTVEHPYSTTVSLTAVATNAGGAAFQHKNAFLVLYRGTQVLAKSPLGNVQPGGVVTVKGSVPEGYWSSYGAKYHPDYVARIEYDLYTKAPSKMHIDADFSNNEKSQSQVPIAAKVEKDYRTWFRAELLKLINQYRATAGTTSSAKTPLKPDPTLEVAAQKNSEWMAAKGDTGHMEQNVFENAAMAWTPQMCLQGWMVSAGHNANMLGPFTKIGIGQKGDYVTARFE